MGDGFGFLRNEARGGLHRSGRRRGIGQRRGDGGGWGRFLGLELEVEQGGEGMIENAPQTGFLPMELVEGAGVRAVGIGAGEIGASGGGLIGEEIAGDFEMLADADGAQVGLERQDAIEAPLGVLNGFEDGGFLRVGGLKRLAEPGAESVVGGGVLMGEDGGLAIGAVAQSVPAGAVLALGGAGAGGVGSVLAVDRSAVGRCGWVGWRMRAWLWVPLDLEFRAAGGGWIWGWAGKSFGWRGKFVFGGCE